VIKPAEGQARRSDHGAGTRTTKKDRGGDFAAGATPYKGGDVREQDQGPARTFGIIRGC